MARWWVLIVLWVSCAISAAVAAAPLRISKAEVRQQVLAVIEAQLAAFRADDVAKAYGYAAAPLQAQTPRRTFAAIVQSNYPELWSNERAEYGLVRDDGMRATVVVHVYSERGYAAFDYVLLRERAGWRIGSIVRHIPRKRDQV